MKKCPNCGWNLAKRKLTDAQVRELRGEYASARREGRIRPGDPKSAVGELARKYGISRAHVSNIGRGVYRGEA